MHEEGGKRFVKVSEACRIFNISRPTLLKWEESGRIKSYRTSDLQTAHRRIDISSHVPGISKHSENGEAREMPKSLPNTSTGNSSTSGEQKRSGQMERQGYCYCRVSSIHQRSDLDRQIQHLQSLYPTYIIIKDCGSGLNYKRRGLQRLIQESIDGKVSEIVIAHRDRLCRFGFELLQFIFERFNVKLIILDCQTHTIDKDAELARDILDIIHVFSCRRNGKRRYKEQEKKEEGTEETESKNGEETGESGEFDVYVSNSNVEEN